VFGDFTVESHNPASYPLMIFNTADPTGMDFDLGTPNEIYGGKGIGMGGKLTNAVPRGNALIISENGNAYDPNDKADGGTITFTFNDPVIFSYLVLIDQEQKPVVKAYDEDDVPLFNEMVGNPGDNSIVYLFREQVNVKTLEVIFPESGAITEICYTKCYHHYTDDDMSSNGDDSSGDGASEGDDNGAAMLAAQNNAV